MQMSTHICDITLTRRGNRVSASVWKSMRHKRDERFARADKRVKSGRQSDLKEIEAIRDGRKGKPVLLFEQTDDRTKEIRLMRAPNRISIRSFILRYTLTEFSSFVRSFIGMDGVISS